MNQFEALLGILAYGVILFLVGLIWMTYKKTISKKTHNNPRLPFPKESRERKEELVSAGSQGR